MAPLAGDGPNWQRFASILVGLGKQPENVREINRPRFGMTRVDASEVPG
jgi:hypothetical protein